MPRILPALVLATLLALALAAAVTAQTATPTPRPLLPAPTKAPVATTTPAAPTPADYEAQALEQLGNLRTIAGGIYRVGSVPTDTVDSAISTLVDEIRPFASSVTPPAEFAPFHMRLFMALRPCEMAVALVQRGGDDVFTAMITSSYTQSCYTAAADASVEWARVTGKAPIF